jgi:hypothetical protein
VAPNDRGTSKLCSVLAKKGCLVGKKKRRRPVRRPVDLKNTPVTGPQTSIAPAKKHWWESVGVIASIVVALVGLVVALLAFNQDRETQSTSMAPDARIVSYEAAVKKRCSCIG